MVLEIFCIFAAEKFYGMGEDILDFGPVKDTMQGIIKVIGAGGNPTIGKQEAESNINDIVKLLSDGTKMVFVRAGMSA